MYTCIEDIIIVGYTIAEVHQSGPDIGIPSLQAYISCLEIYLALHIIDLRTHQLNLNKLVPETKLFSSFDELFHDAFKFNTTM